MFHLDQSALPRVKPIYPIYRLNESTFRIGAQLGITLELDDPEGHAWTLAHLLDGTRTLPEIVATIRTTFPALSETDVLECVATFDDEGLLEDARSRVGDGSTASDGLDRWVGNVNYFSHFSRLARHREDPHEKLRRSTVVLLGLGGAGSMILPILAATGVGRIVGVDYDRVEPSNLNRQLLYRERDYGRYKTEVAEEVMAAINSDLDFSTVTAKMEYAEDVAPIVRGADLVICAIDEPPFLAQRRVNRACIQENVACVYGFLQVTRGRVFTVLPHESGCFDCLNIHYSKKDARFVPQFAGFHASKFEPPTIAYSPDVVRLAGMMVIEATRLLTGYAAPKSVATQFELDFEADTSYPLVDWPRYAGDCPTCGAGREQDWPIFGVYPGPVSRTGAIANADAA
jgi:molybdopterin/thiamine biosynthesis adenylyltransferase